MLFSESILLGKRGSSSHAILSLILNYNIVYTSNELKNREDHTSPKSSPRVEIIARFPRSLHSFQQTVSTNLRNFLYRPIVRIVRSV